jgi:predicted nucleic acid-binding protein
MRQALSLRFINSKTLSWAPMSSSQREWSSKNCFKEIVERFASLPLLQPDREDHIAAADLRNKCRRAGIQVGTIDALLAQLCIRHDLTLLSTNNDFKLAAPHCALRVWAPKTGARRK